MNIAGETITNSSTQSSQVQSDWTQATTTALDYIKNKPVLSTVATITTIDLTNTATYLTTRFYPIVISQAGMFRYDIAVDMPSQVGTVAYNAHWIQGWVQTGGWTDQLPRLFELAHGYFDGNERSILGVYVGTQNFYEGVVVYVRGGGTYLIKTPATSVVAYSAAVTLPVSGGNQSTFAIKDGNGLDVVGTTTNAILLFYGTTSTTGTYKSGVHVIQNVNSTYGFPATTGSFASDTKVHARINGSDIVLDTGFDGNGPVWLQARRLSNFADKFSLVLNPNGGNVGIGVNPSAALDIVDQTNGIIQFSEYNSTDGVAIRARRARGTIAAPTAVVADDTLVALRGFGYNSAAFSGRCVGIEMAAAETFTATATGTYMAFHTCASTTTTNSEKVRILGNGNVGIGTTGPGYKLVVNNTNGTGPAALIQASGITAGQNMSLILGKTNTNSNSGTILWNHVGDGLGTNYLGLGYWGGDNVLNVTASSNVGIGTSTPSAKFHVVGTSASPAIAKFVSPSGQNCYLIIDPTDAAQQAALQFNRAGSVQWINYVPGSSTEMRWYNGSVDRMVLTNAGALTCSNDITAFSDIRHKTNLQKIPDALDKVSALNGYTFNRTDEEDKEKRYAGVVAQEVLEVLPEVVHENKDGIYSVAYGNLTALLIEALKEERKKREALEARVAKLESL